MEKILKLREGVFLKTIPLKGNPLKSINIYIVKSNDEALIIDTGFNTEEIKAEMMDYIENLKLDLKKTSLFLTHLHSDHTGLVNFFENMGLKIYMGDVDYNLMQDFTEEHGGRWDKIVNYAHMQGLDEDNLKIAEHPGFKYRPREYFNHISKNPGDTLDVGDFHFEVVDFSGHTPGMVGLYERSKKLMFSADHILAKITPNIQFWGFEFGDSLGTYLKNLEGLKNYEIDGIFSSHRELIEDIDKRIEELFLHHQKRLDEAIKAMEKFGEVTVRDVTKNLHWDISAKNFDEFPSSQKWFAAGEAHAHLEHLRAKGICDYKKTDTDVLKYYLK